MTLRASLRSAYGRDHLVQNLRSECKWRQKRLVSALDNRTNTDVKLFLSASPAISSTGLCTPRKSKRYFHARTQPMRFVPLPCTPPWYLHCISSPVKEPFCQPILAWRTKLSSPLFCPLRSSLARRLLASLGSFGGNSLRAWSAAMAKRRSRFGLARYIISPKWGYGFLLSSIPLFILGQKKRIFSFWRYRYSFRRSIYI